MEINTMETVTAKQLLDHWQGHRGLTRKMIEAFPEEEFFRFSIGGMRPFAELAWEMLSIAAPGMQGMVTGEWPSLGGNGHRYETDAPKSKSGFLEKWDESTEMLNRLWPELPQERFQQTVMAFGQYEGTVFSTIMYFIDNEIHHRGQGYVYLRALGIEPPAFWDRNL